MSGSAIAKVEAFFATISMCLLKVNLVSRKTPRYLMWPKMTAVWCPPVRRHGEVNSHLLVKFSSCSEIVLVRYSSSTRRYSLVQDLVYLPGPALIQPPRLLPVHQWISPADGNRKGWPISGGHRRQLSIASTPGQNHGGLPQVKGILLTDDQWSVGEPSPII